MTLIIHGDRPACSSRDPRATAEQWRSAIVGTPEYPDDLQGGVLCPKSLFTLYKPVHETGARPHQPLYVCNDLVTMAILMCMPMIQFFFSRFPHTENVDIKV